MKKNRRAALQLAAVTILGFAATSCAGLDKTPQTVLVAGATGQTGQHLVRELQRDGYKVRALVRDTSKAASQLGPDVALVQGDVKEPASLAAAVSGVDAVISSIGARGKDGPDRPEMVDFEGVRNLVDAARAAKVQQFVLVSSRGVTQADHPLNRMFGDVLVWKLKGEDHLRASGLAYTIVRPGGLLNEPAGKGDIVFEQGDRRFGGSTLAIPRADVAIVCVQALRNPESKFRTFEIHRAEGPPVTDWRAKFASLKPDQK
ncbi:MAG: SDR family oxidoreductase [Gammaproteobacteria bacterium]|nr:SDR family oxidoreductase [Gammaproteobacteria bacterium]